MKILAIDLGKFKSVACLYTDPTADHKFATLETGPPALEQLITVSQPDNVVFETCTAAGWPTGLFGRVA